MTDPPDKQLEKIQELARELEVAQDANHFDDTVRRIAKTPPKGAPPSKQEPDDGRG